MALHTVLVLASFPLVVATGPTLPCLQKNCGAFMTACRLVQGCNAVISCMQGCSDSNCENTCFDTASSSAGTLAAADLATVSMCGGAKGCFHYGSSTAVKNEKSRLAADSGSLVTFDSGAGTTFTFTELNDPVMGGKSNGTWTLGDGFGIIDGEVVNVPSLSAPGFIKAAANGQFSDISDFINGSLVLTVRSSTPDYAGFRVSFASGAAMPSYSCGGGGGIPFSRGCFKQKFSVPAGSEFVEVKIPFNTFSDKWSSATGEQTTTCANDEDVCPTASKLSKIQRVEFWGEGANGKLHLEIKSVSAEKSSGERLDVVV